MIDFSPEDKSRIEFIQIHDYKTDLLQIPQPRCRAPLLGGRLAVLRQTVETQRHA